MGGREASRISKMDYDSESCRGNVAANEKKRAQFADRANNSACSILIQERNS